jgi:hypothetical protein
MQYIKGPLIIKSEVFKRAQLHFEVKYFLRCPHPTKVGDRWSTYSKHQEAKNLGQSDEQ